MKQYTILIILLSGFLLLSGCEKQPIPEDPPIQQEETHKLEVAYLSVHDERWKDISLSNAGKGTTIEKDGTALLSLLMVANYFYHGNETPLSLDPSLLTEELNWEKTAFQLNLALREYGWANAQLLFELVKAQIDQGNTMILTLCNDTVYAILHVVVTGYDENTQTIYLLNPNQDTDTSLQDLLDQDYSFINYQIYEAVPQEARETLSAQEITALFEPLIGYWNGYARELYMGDDIAELYFAFLYDNQQQLFYWDDEYTRNDGDYTGDLIVPNNLYVEEVEKTGEHDYILYIHQENSREADRYFSIKLNNEQIDSQLITISYGYRYGRGSHITQYIRTGDTLADALDYSYYKEFRNKGEKDK